MRTNLKYNRSPKPVHTLTCRMQFFCAQRAHCVLRISSCVSHTRMPQVLEKVYCTCVVSLHLAFSFLMIHPSSLAVLWWSLREVAEKLKNWEYACCEEGNYSKQRSIRIMIRNHKQWVYSSRILTYWAVMTYLLFLLRRVQESRAAKLECREIHQIIWVFLEAFLCLSTCSTRSWWIIQLFEKFGNTIGIADDVKDSEKRRNWE